MKTQVLAAISSTQKFEGSEEEHVELVTCASLYGRQGKFYIAYDESELTGLNGTRTTVKLDGKSVTLIRTGAYPSHMQFTEGERQVGLYDTGFGMLTISTHASHVHNTVDENGGELAIDYTIEIDQNVAGRHHFEMVITPQDMNEN